MPELPNMDSGRLNVLAVQINQYICVLLVIAYFIPLTTEIMYPAEEKIIGVNVSKFCAF